MSFNISFFIFLGRPPTLNTLLHITLMVWPWPRSPLTYLQDSTALIGSTCCLIVEKGMMIDILYMYLWSILKQKNPHLFFMYMNWEQQIFTTRKKKCVHKEQIRIWKKIQYYTNIAWIDEFSKQRYIIQQKF